MSASEGRERGADRSARDPGAAPHSGGSRVEKEIRIDAPPERVWEAWADPDLIAGWFVDRAVGRAREGGSVTWTWESFGVEVEQEVVTADAPGRLVLRSAGRYGEPEVLEVTLERESGSTVLRLVQSGFGEHGPGDPPYDGTDSGWSMALALLRRYVERFYGRPKVQLLVLRPVSRPCARAHALYRDEEALAGWMDDVPEGEVLADSGTEVARSWEAVDGTLELKAFSDDEGTCTVGFRATSWSLSGEGMAALRPDLEDAVERLVRNLAPART